MDIKLFFRGKLVHVLQLLNQLLDIKSSSWCSFTKWFKGFSIQYINCSRESFIVPYWLFISLSILFTDWLLLFFYFHSLLSLYSRALASFHSLNEKCDILSEKKKKKPALGKCFRCGQKRHLANECPQRKTLAIQEEGEEADAFNGKILRG